jgi:hypothetical protein
LGSVVNSARKRVGGLTVKLNLTKYETLARLHEKLAVFFIYFYKSFDDLGQKTNEQIILLFV